jgi:YVTN family beta-propeller protein
MKICLLKIKISLIVLALLLPIGGCKRSASVSEALGTVQIPSERETTYPEPPETLQASSGPEAMCPAGNEICLPKVIDTIPLYPPGPGGIPTDVTVNFETGHVYVVNESGHVAVLQGTERIIFLSTGEPGPAALALDEERDWAYAINRYEDSVTVIQGTEVITTLETAGREPTDAVVEPESGWAYVVSGYRKLPPFGEEPVVEGNVTVISGDRVVGVVPLGDVVARHVVADAVNGYVYIGGVGGDVVALKGMEEAARFNVGNTVKAMDADRRTGEVYVLSAFGYLTRMQGAEVEDTIKAESGAARNMRVHPVTGDVYVVDYTRQEVIVVRDMEVIGRVPVGWGPLKMAIDPLTGNVYVANFQDDTVTVIHGTEALATIDVGWYPYGIGVNPANGWVYVSNTNDHTVTVLGFREEEGHHIFMPLVLKGHKAAV